MPTRTGRILTAEESARLETGLAEAKAEVAACIQFLEAELHWEYFRAEMLFIYDTPQATASLENARKLKNFLAQTGHGIGLLQELRDLRARVANANTNG